MDERRAWRAVPRWAGLCADWQAAAELEDESGDGRRIPWVGNEIVSPASPSIELADGDDARRRAGEPRAEPPAVTDVDLERIARTVVVAAHAGAASAMPVVELASNRAAARRRRICRVCRDHARRATYELRVCRLRPARKVRLARTDPDRALLEQVAHVDAAAPDAHERAVAAVLGQPARAAHRRRRALAARLEAALAVAPQAANLLLRAPLLGGQRARGARASRGRPTRSCRPPAAAG